ncbi:MAG: helix-turn-helix transcriptional regulator [Pseudomonadota bacterium]
MVNLLVISQMGYDLMGSWWFGEFAVGQQLMDDDHTILDRIYEAAAIPENWSGLLHDLSRIAGARGAVMFVANPSTAQWIASPGIYGLIDNWFRDGWSRDNTRGNRLASANTPGFVRDIDIYDNRQQIDEDPQIKHFLRPRGVGWAAAAIIPVPSGDSLIFSFERKFELGPVTDAVMPRLEMIRPHLARAALFAARLGMQQARAMTDSFKLLGLPAATLNRSGRLVAANELFQKLVPGIFADRRERLVLAHASSDRLLLSAITRLNLGVDRARILSLPIPATDGNAAMALHVLPVRRAANDVFSLASSVIVATPVDRAASPSAELLQGLFDLTPAEARVARAISEARTVEEIATQQGVTVGTVRIQLKQIFAKTGTNRQVRLAQLLSGLALRGND